MEQYTDDKPLAFRSRDHQLQCERYKHATKSTFPGRSKKSNKLYEQMRNMGERRDYMQKLGQMPCIHAQVVGHWAIDSDLPPSKT